MTRSPIAARRRRFVLETPLESPDGFGGVVRAFAAGPELWGAIELVSPRRSGAVTHRVTVAYRPGVSDAMRLTLGQRRFRIRSAEDPDGRRRDLVCLVEEIAR